jgi:hypothetical protein
MCLKHFALKNEDRSKNEEKKVMGIWEGIIWMEKRALKLISQINLSLLLLANIKTILLEFGITSFLLL